MTEPKEWRKHWTGDREYCVSCGRTPKQGHLRACVFSKLARAERENERLREALADIAEGNAQVSDEMLENRAAMTAAMWSYSQKRARAALEEESDE